MSGDGVDRYFSLFYLFFCSHTSGVALVVFLNKFCGVEVLFWFPTIMGVGISLPLDQELGLILITSCVHYLIYFPFWFPFYQIRGRFWEVCSMYGCLFVWHQEQSMKHWVDAPLWWKFQGIGSCQDFSCNGEGAISFWS